MNSVPVPQVANSAPHRMPVACRKMKLSYLRVVDLGVEAERAVDALEADLGGVGGLDLQARIADLERAGCVMSAMGEQLERGGRPLDALHRRAGDHP